MPWASGCSRRARPAPRSTKPRSACGRRPCRVLARSNIRRPTCARSSPQTPNRRSKRQPRRKRRQTRRSPRQHRNRRRLHAAGANPHPVGPSPPVNARKPTSPTRTSREAAAAPLSGPRHRSRVGEFCPRIRRHRPPCSAAEWGGKRHGAECRQSHPVSGTARRNRPRGRRDGSRRPAASRLPDDRSGCHRRRGRGSRRRLPVAQTRAQRQQGEGSWARKSIRRRSTATRPRLTPADPGVNTRITAVSARRAIMRAVSAPDWSTRISCVGFPAGSSRASTNSS
ncbi:hypothetical protein ebA611 [Aromatoleum aromaticum EbN1]|uniref:Uncharacterized protein n=1 Tax=Aromatoleum aromaticum (strain DSM 19018 / LMG 30748 / EbN1) TaxID=76114 RepID=Q5P8B9_AROAE|nr:hypothetical protein ebA611 [Aromatoleum aromaticum EbN1]